MNLKLLPLWVPCPDPWWCYPEHRMEPTGNRNWINQTTLFSHFSFYHIFLKYLQSYKMNGSPLFSFSFPSIGASSTVMPQYWSVTACMGKNVGNVPHTLGFTQAYNRCVLPQHKWELLHANETSRICMLLPSKTELLQLNFWTKSAPEIYPSPKYYPHNWVPQTMKARGLFQWSLFDTVTLTAKMALLFSSQFFTWLWISEAGLLKWKYNNF